MESQPQNPEFRTNPENFHPWINNESFHPCTKSRIAKAQYLGERPLLNGRLRYGYASWC